MIPRRSIFMNFELIDGSTSKMVDAHIKQWRCTKLPHVTDACALPMSSSAIRFRHEREQHDDSSFWCLVEGCDRSKQVAPSKAFARQYNRNDHLHRKHGWSKELAEVQDKRWIGHDPETDPPAARAAAAGARKRRAGRSEQAEGKRLAPVDAAQARDVALARQRMARAKKHAKQKAALQEQRASAAPVETAEPAQGEDNSPLEGFMLPDMAQGHAAGLAPGRPASTRPQAHVHGQSQIGPVSRPSLNARHPVLVAASDIESFDNLDARSEDQKLAAEWIALFHAMHNDLHRYGPKTHAAMGSQAETDETLLRLQNGADLAFIERLEAKARKLAEGARAFLTRKAANEGVDPNSFR